MYGLMYDSKVILKWLFHLAEYEGMSDDKIETVSGRACLQFV